MVRTVLVAALLLVAGAAYAQFNRCGPGFCPGGMFGEPFQPPGGAAIPPPVCNPGNDTGELDFSLCSNLGKTVVIW